MDQHGGPEGEYSVHSAEEKMKYYRKKRRSEISFLIGFIVVFFGLALLYGFNFKEIFNQDIHWIAGLSTIAVAAYIALTLCRLINQSGKEYKSFSKKYKYHRKNYLDQKPPEGNKVYLRMGRLHLTKAAR